MTPEGWVLLGQGIEALKAIALAWIVYMTAHLSRDMRTLERNTNSIKDELVAVTKTAAHAAGVLDEKTRQKG